MSIEELPKNSKEMNVAPESPSQTTGFIVIIVVLALLAIGQFYTMSRLSSMRAYLDAEQVKMRAELTAKLDQQVAAMEQSNAQVLQGFKDEMSASTERVGKTQSEVRRERAMVAKLSKLQSQYEQQSDQLKQQMAQKADQQQVGALTQDVSATKEDLGNTKKTVDELNKNLGMARSELGTLIATNHSEIEELRKMGDRDYFEFALNKNQEKSVAGVGLVLKKTNPKRNQFTLALLADDLRIEKRNRTANEPIVFSVRGSKKFYELVVNKVQSDTVTGYLSTPKGAAELAQR